MRRTRLGLAGLLAAALLAGAAAPAPVVRFAIDQDYTPQTQSPARVAQDFPLVRALGLRVLRTGIGWDDTNPGPQRFDWRFWSRVTAAAAAAGIRLRPYYDYTPSWAGAAYNAPPRDPAGFARACAVMAAVLGGRVDSLEIWNEPDNPDFWTGTAGGFGQLLRPCADAIHRVRPRIDVVQGGLVYLDSTFYARMGEAALGSVNVAAYHEYTEVPWDGTTVELDNSAGYFDTGYDIMSGRGRRPVWMDEGGASTAVAQGYSEQSQASWIRRTVASLLGHPGRPVALIGLYQLRDPDPASVQIGDAAANLFFHHTGLFTLDGHPKLAAAAVADLVGLLDGRRPAPQPEVRYVAASGTPSALLRVYDLRLEDGRQVVFIWDRAASSSGSITLPYGGRSAVLHAVNGAVSPVAGFAGRVLPVGMVAAGGMPLLFEVR